MSGPVSWSFTTGALLPAVSFHTPASGANGVAVASTPTATFNEAVRAGTISVTLTSSAGTSVAGALSYNSTTDTATFTPSALLAYGTTYTATVSGAQSQSGAAMASPVEWTFTTASAPAIPVVTITSVEPVLKKRRPLTQVVITFSGPIDAGEASLLQYYRLTIAGKHGSFTARNARFVRLRSAVCDSATNSVTLTSSKPFSLATPLQLIVFGQPPSGLEDASGRLIDGGTNAVAILRRGGVTITQ